MQEYIDKKTEEDEHQYEPYRGSPPRTGEPVRQKYPPSLFASTFPANKDHQHKKQPDTKVAPQQVAPNAAVPTSLPAALPKLNKPAESSIQSCNLDVIHCREMSIRPSQAPSTLKNDPITFVQSPSIPTVLPDALPPLPPQKNTQVTKPTGDPRLVAKPPIAVSSFLPAVLPKLSDTISNAMVIVPPCTEVVDVAALVPDPEFSAKSGFFTKHGLDHSIHPSIAKIENLSPASNLPISPQHKDLNFTAVFQKDTSTVMEVVASAPTALSPKPRGRRVRAEVAIERRWDDELVGGR